MVHLADGQRLIIDYKRVVEYNQQTMGAPIAFPGLWPTGESDIKFARYIDLFGNALVHAIDGDYMAIALLYYALRRSTSARIYIYRQLAQLPEPEKKKRKLDSAKTPKKKAAKCWVDMQMIYSHIAGCVGGDDPPRAVHAAVSLMLCAGTDFSRPIPLIGPKRMWDALPLVVDNLVLAASMSSRLFDYPLFADGVIAVLYKNVFARHTSSSTHGFSAVMHELRSTSTLAPSTIGRLPSEAQILTTLKNINWVVHGYWTVINGAILAPLDGSNGFVPAGNNKVAYEDLRTVNSS
jgi:hypothetical protein